MKIMSKAAMMAVGVLISLTSFDPAYARGGGGDWPVFWRAFQRAALQGNRASLSRLMSADIDMQNSGGRGRDFATRDLHYHMGELRTLARRPPVAVKPAANGYPAKAINVNSACPRCEYGLYVRFERRRSGWAWVELSFPGD